MPQYFSCTGFPQLRRCLIELFAVQGERTLLVFMLTVIIVFTEGIGLLLLVPLLSAAGVETEVGEELGHLISLILSSLGIESGLLPILGVFVAINLGRIAIVRWQTVSIASLTEQFLHHLRVRLYRGVVYSEYEYITGVRIADVVHALTEEIGRVGVLVNQVFHVTAHGIVTIVFIVIASQVSWEATLVTVICAALLFGSLWGKVRESEEYGQQITERSRSIVGQASEHLAGIKVSKAFRAESEYVRAYSESSSQVENVNLEAIKNHADVAMLFQAFSVVLACLVLFVALEWLDVKVGSLIVLILIFARLVPRFSLLQYGIQMIINNVPAFTSINALTSAAETYALVREDSPGDVRKGQIIFDNVYFRYEGTDSHIVLRDVTAEIAPRTTVYVSGLSGAGKSTLADLIMGLLIPSSGNVLVGGKVAYVPQDPFLFNGSVRMNMSWVSPHISENEIWEALEMARASEFVRKLPEGLNTIVGERGITLSGGERQRLCLARALVSKSDVLLLDEATNALDASSEEEIYKALRLLRGKMTLVVITHRPINPEYCDAILNVENGTVRVVRSNSYIV